MKKTPQGSIKGTCIHMCPVKERILRENEGLLHRFESANASTLESDTDDQIAKTRRALQLAEESGPSAHGGSYNKVSSSWKHSAKSSRPKPKADINRTIKSFARSAAGLDKTKPEDLRPPNVLEATLAYLYKEILPKTNEPYIVIYDFVFDRLRSVRQDLVIQRIADRTAIKIVESIIRFHIYSGFRLKNESPSVFDSHINDKHLMDCLKTLLGLYEENDYMEPSRVEFEALHVLLHPDSIPVLSRAMSLSPRIRNNEEFNCAIKMSLAYQFKNYVAYFRLGRKLRPLLSSCVVRHARQIRSNAYRAMSLAYGVQTCKVPLSVLATVLDYPHQAALELDLACYSINLITDQDSSGSKYARFDKNFANIPTTQVQNLTSEFGDASSGCNAMTSSVCLYSSD